jgi:hypothetical protein
MATADMVVEFEAVPDLVVQHFFVSGDSADPEVTAHIGGLDPDVDEPPSITRFLNLPTITRQRHTRIRDPISDFAQSKILTYDQYTTAVEQMKMASEMAQLAKEQQRVDRQVSKKRKEREKGHLAKAIVREEAARMKELRATKYAALWANRQALRDEVQRICAERLATTAAAQAAKKARKTAERQEQQRLQATRAAEMAQGGQGYSRNVNTTTTEPEVPSPNTSSSIPEHFPHFPTPQNLSYFFSSSTTFPHASPAHLSFQRLNSPMQSMPPSHPMVHFSTPFQVFQNSLQHTSPWSREMSNHHGMEHH